MALAGVFIALDAIENVVIIGCFWLNLCAVGSFKASQFKQLKLAANTTLTS